MKIDGLKVGGLLLACHVCLATPAHAQLTAPRETAQIELGPVSLYPSLQILDAGRDRNVFNDGTEPKDDYTFTVSSRALIVVKLGLNELMFSTGNDYVWFKEYASERSSNAQYAVRFNLSASRFKPYVGALYMRTRDRPSLEIDTRARRTERELIGGFAVELSPRTAITASIRQEDSSYEEGQEFRGVELGNALNRTGRFLSVGGRYSLTPLTTLLISGDVSEDTFPDSHVRDSKSYSVVPVLEFSADAAIRGRLMAGYQVFKPNNPTLEEYRGPIMAAGVNWTLFNRTTFDLQANRNVTYSYQDTAPYYLLTGSRLSIGQPLFGPIDLLGTLDWENMAYRWHQGQSPGAVANRTDRTKTFGGGVGVNLRRGFRLVLGAERIERKSNEDPRQNFRRTRLLSTVTIGS